MRQPYRQSSGARPFGRLKKHSRQRPPQDRSVVRPFAPTACRTQKPAGGDSRRKKHGKATNRSTGVARNDRRRTSATEQPGPFAASLSDRKALCPSGPERYRTRASRKAQGPSVPRPIGMRLPSPYRNPHPDYRRSPALSTISLTGRFSVSRIFRTISCSVACTSRACPFALTSTGKSHSSSPAGI